MFKWLKSLFFKEKIESDFNVQLVHFAKNRTIWNKNFKAEDVKKALDKQAPKRPRLYKQATVVTTGELPKEKKMPLKKGTSNATRQKNIATEIKAGKKPSQAVAIGYAVQREAKAKAKPASKGKK